MKDITHSSRIVETLQATMSEKKAKQKFKVDTYCCTTSLILSNSIVSRSGKAGGGERKEPKTTTYC